MPTFNHELAATVLVEAIYIGDRQAAQKYGVSERTIRNWRKRLADDPHFAAFFQHKKSASERDWGADLIPAIRASIEFVQRAARELDTANPEAVHAVAGALKILTEVALTREVIDARLARLAKSGGQPAQTA